MGGFRFGARRSKRAEGSPQVAASTKEALSHSPKVTRITDPSDHDVQFLGANYPGTDLYEAKENIRFGNTARVDIHIPQAQGEKTSIHNAGFRKGQRFVVWHPGLRGRGDVSEGSLASIMSLKGYRG